MCYSSMLTKNQKELEREFLAKFSPEAAVDEGPDYSGFVFPKTPIISSEAPEIITAGQWGLIPGWANDTEIRKFTLNARIETLNVKPSFKDVLDHRCLVIADGFYEWQTTNIKTKKKVKYKITLPDEQAYAYAGLWSEWVDQETGEIIKTYTIVTTEANELMSEIHNVKKRMPVILKKEDREAWLQGENYQAFALPYQVDLVAKPTTQDPQLGLF